METLQVSAEAMDYVWRVMRFECSIGYVAFGWRMRDGLIVLSYPKHLSDEGEVKSWIH